MRTSIATLAVAALISILIVAVAQAAPTEVNVRIEGRGETLFEGPILTEGHDVRASSDTKERSCDGVDKNDPENVTPGPTPTAASVDAMSLIGETFDGQWYNGYEDYFITRWGPDEQSTAEGAYWGILVDNVFTSIGGCQYELGAGSEVLWVYNAFASRPLLALFPVAAGYTSGARPLTATAELDKPFEVEVVDYTDLQEDKPPADPERAGSSPYEGADVSPLRISAKGFEKVETGSPETVKTNAEGKASITFTTPGWHRIKATAVNAGGREDAIRSNRLDVCVPEAGVSGCGEPPAEDQVRTPARYSEEVPAQSSEEVKEEHHEETKATGPGEDPGGGQPGATGMGTAPPISSTPPTPALTVSRPAARLTVTSVRPARLLLKFTAAGEATVRIARQVGEGHHRHLQAVKTIIVKVSKAGQIEVELPRLAAGRYRVSIDLDGGESVVKTLTLTVPRK